MTTSPRPGESAAHDGTFLEPIAGLRLSGLEHVAHGQLCRALQAAGRDPAGVPAGLYLAFDFQFASVEAGVWLLLVFYALAASVGTVWLWMTGSRHLRAAHSGIFTVLLPVAAALVGLLALGESLSGVQVLAFAIALLGVALTWNHEPRRDGPARDPV